MNNFYNENSIFRHTLYCPHCNRMQSFQSTGLINKYGIEYACNACGYTQYIYQMLSTLGYGEYD